MFIALDKDKNRIAIEDAVSDVSYLCPVCGNPVIVKAANSSNVRTHFAHKRNSLCLDDWHHDMSEWHLEWQSKFPIENREVVVENSGATHRADILINGTVIEFQHSPISAEEFDARNSFYKGCGYRVVWLFDVTDKMKKDDCFGLVWKRKNPLFEVKGTAPDAIYVQHFLPDSKDDILRIAKPSPKEIMYYQTTKSIKSENFLKEYGAIRDDGIPSIHNIFEETEAYIKAEEKLRREREAARLGVLGDTFLKAYVRPRPRRRF